MPQEDFRTDWLKCTSNTKNEINSLKTYRMISRLEIRIIGRDLTWSYLRTENKFQHYVFLFSSSIQAFWCPFHLLSVSILKSQRILGDTFSKILVCILVYHLSALSNFYLLHNSQWIAFPTHSCLLSYCFLPVCCIHLCDSGSCISHLSVWSNFHLLLLLIRVIWRRVLMYGSSTNQNINIIWGFLWRTLQYIKGNFLGDCYCFICEADVTILVIFFFFLLLRLNNIYFSFSFGL